MATPRRRTLGATLLTAALVASSVVVGPGPTLAVEVGEPAPDFRLASTSGLDIALGDFRGTKYVLLEFYGADFSPT